MLEVVNRKVYFFSFFILALVYNRNKNICTLVILSYSLPGTNKRPRMEMRCVRKFYLVEELQYLRFKTIIINTIYENFKDFLQAFLALANSIGHNNF